MALDPEIHFKETLLGGFGKEARQFFGGLCLCWNHSGVREFATASGRSIPWPGHDSIELKPRRDHHPLFPPVVAKIITMQEKLQGVAVLVVPKSFEFLDNGRKQHLLTERDS